jgi:hypothetical protein
LDVKRRYEMKSEVKSITRLKVRISRKMHQKSYRNFCERFCLSENYCEKARLWWKNFEKIRKTSNYFYFEKSIFLVFYHFIFGMYNDFLASTRKKMFALWENYFVSAKNVSFFHKFFVVFENRCFLKKSLFSVTCRS